MWHYLYFLTTFTSFRTVPNAINSIAQAMWLSLLGLMAWFGVGMNYHPCLCL